MVSGAVTVALALEKPGALAVIVAVCAPSRWLSLVMLNENAAEV